MQVRAGVYEIVNIVNGKRYIGSSVNASGRMRGHERNLQLCRYGNSHFQHAWNKHGEENFIFRVLLYCNVEMLLVYEQMCLDRFKPEYNICSRAGNTIGYVHGEAARQKMSAARKGISPWNKGKSSWSKGKCLSEEHKRKIGEGNKGKFVSEETRAKIGASHVGMKFSDEALLKMSLSHKGNKYCLGHHLTEEHKQKISQRLMGNSYTLGHVLSEEHKRKISEAGKGRTHAAETCRKISQTKRERGISEEARKKMSEAKKRYWEAKHVNSNSL
jgi:group I intron endonuclease